MNNLRKKLFSAIMISAFSLPVSAQGIILNHQDLRTDLNWLNQQGVIQISTSTWPLSGDEIERALEGANPTNLVEQKVLNSVRSSLAAQNTTAKLSLYAESDPRYFPQPFADTEKAQYQATLELNAGSTAWDGKLKINAEKDQIIQHEQDVNIEGSYLAGKLWNQWLIVGQIPTYWGPGHEGSLIRGDVSRPVYGLTLQRAEQTPFETKWLSWIGNWQYQLFGGQLDDYTAVPNTKLIGMRLTSQPFPYLELGISRVIQWGGQGRPNSLSSLWDAIGGGKDNIDDPNMTATDPSNQLAGIDGRFNLNQWTGLPVSFYGQAIGEDEAGGLPSRKLYLAGIDYSSQFKKLPYQLYAEWSDTRTNGEVRNYTYTHHIYRDGYYQHGYPLGHAMGGDGQMYSLGGDIRFDFMNRLSGRLLLAKVNQSGLEINHAFPQKDEVKALDITWTHYMRPNLPLKINGWITDSEYQGNDSGASLRIEIPLDASLF